MISPISVATRGYLPRTPRAISTRGYIAGILSGITIYGNGILLSDESDLYGLAFIDKVYIEITRLFTVGISLSQSFKVNIARKLKFKVNK